MGAIVVVLILATFAGADGRDALAVATGSLPLQGTPKEQWKPQADLQRKLVDMVLPFIGSYRPVWLGLGTVAVDLLLVITGVSLLRNRVGPRIFKGVHWLTYALWPVALAHSLGTGTDAGTLWMDGIAAGCVAAVLAAVAWRTSPTFAHRGWTRLPRQVAR